jgi:hypothetical protein
MAAAPAAQSPAGNLAESFLNLHAQPHWQLVNCQHISVRQSTYRTL